jgi:signal transduction histidine kinase
MSKLVRILLIEDSTPDAEYLRSSLARARSNTQFAIEREVRLQAGLERLARERFDIVLLDLTLPDSSGPATFTKFLAAQPDIPLVILTSTEDEQMGVEAIEQGAQEYLVKGHVGPAALARCVRYAIERTAHEQARRQLAAQEEALAYAQLREAFIEVASHELRTPLTILRGVTEIAKDDANLSDEQRTLITLIDRAGIRLSRVVEQMIAMLMAQRVEPSSSYERLEVAPLLRETAALVRTFVARRNQQLELTLPNDLGAVEADADKLRDAISNLLLNAIRFTPDGGLIRLEARREGAEVVIDVSDDGIGIAPEALGRVFEPFFTALDAEHHASGHFEFNTRGVGLGLTLVKLFVEMNGGNVTVASTLDVGTTVTVRLPRLEDGT